MINRVIIVAHCLLNYHSKVLDSGVINQAGKIMIQPLLERGYGIFQLPCPEFTHGGMKRWGQSRSQYNNPFFISHCRMLAEEVANQFEEYFRNGYIVGPVLGINGSPSCGIDFSFDGSWGGEIGCSTDRLVKKIRTLTCIQQPGVFMEVLKHETAIRKINLMWMGVDENNPGMSLEKILSSIDYSKEANY